MTTVVDSPKPIKVGDSLIPQMRAYGVSEENASLCYNCGNCTAVCNLVGNGNGDGIFPRKTIRLLQLGMKDELLASTEPWNCYYCGDCSTSCPRGAEPGEVMMGVRRFLTAEYDTTGQGRRLYSSLKAVWAAILFWFIGPLIFLGALHLLGFASINTDTVALNEFAPSEIIWTTSHIYGIFLSLVLLLNIRNMWKNVMDKERTGLNIKFSDYLKELKTLVTTTATQKEWRSCGSRSQRMRWGKHFLLMIGYITMFVLIVGFLPWFQTDEVHPIYHPQRLIGYIATVFLVVTTVEILYRRWKADGEQMHRHSHHTDWFFPISLLMVALTGIAVSFLRIGGYPLLTYGMYAIHLSFTAVMLSTEVGIGKWTHIFYRPLGRYFSAVKQRARARQVAAIN